MGGAAIPLQAEPGQVSEPPINVMPACPSGHTPYVQQPHIWPVTQHGIMYGGPWQGYSSYVEADPAMIPPSGTGVADAFGELRRTQGRVVVVHCGHYSIRAKGAHPSPAIFREGRVRAVKLERCKVAVTLKAHSTSVDSRNRHGPVLHASDQPGMQWIVKILVDILVVPLTARTRA